MANKRSLTFNAKRFFRGIGDRKTTRLYRKKQAIYSQGDVAEAMYYIHTGIVKLTASSKRGKRAVVAILGKDEFFGEGCLGASSRRISSATAMEECTIVRVRKTIVLEVIHEEPAFAKLVISHLLARMTRFEQDLLEHIFSNSEKRLARLLLLLVGFGRSSKSERPLVKVNQQTLAEMVGTTRSRVSFFMNRFRALGYIRYNGHLEVRKSLLTFLLHDQRLGAAAIRKQPARSKRR